MFTNKRSGIFFVLVLAAALTGCETENYFERLPETDAAKAGTALATPAPEDGRPTAPPGAGPTAAPTAVPTTVPGPTATPGTGGACHSESFSQPVGDQRPLDILFVLDTSGSMGTHRAQVANALGSFVNQLPAGADYQVGIMLAHGSASNWSGALWYTANHPSILKSSTMTTDQIRSHLIYNATNVASDPNGQGETGMYSLTKGMQAAKYSTIQSQGFFRPNATLAVVFVADERDICAMDPVAEADETVELGVYRKDCLNAAGQLIVTPQSTISAVKAARGTAPVVFGAIVATGSDPATSDNPWAEKGEGYLQIAQLTNGVVGDVFAADYGPSMTAIGQLAARNMTLLYDFTLANSPVQANTIAVKVDGNATNGFTFTAATNVVHVNNPGGSGSTVAINYCLKP